MSHARAVTAGVLLALLVVIAVRADIGPSDETTSVAAASLIIVFVIILLLDVDLASLYRKLRNRE